MPKYRLMVKQFQAGQLRHSISAWESLTSDPYILDAIKHYHIEFEFNVPWQAHEPRQIKSSTSEKEIISGEVSKLLSKGVIEKTCHKDNGFVSNVFVRPKKDGTHRMILNLKSSVNLSPTNILKWTTFKWLSDSCVLIALWHQ